MPALAGSDISVTVRLRPPRLRVLALWKFGEACASIDPGRSHGVAPAALGAGGCGGPPPAARGRRLRLTPRPAPVKATASRRPSAGPDGLAFDCHGPPVLAPVRV